jgi:putative transposase
MQTLQELQHGCYYHVYNRGNNQQNLFLEERNYTYFLSLYAKHVEPIAETFAYCLMPNHFHVLVKVRDLSALPPGQASPSKHFSNLFNAYSKSINKAQARTGSLFQKRFGRIPVKSDRYFAALVRYIHRNPQTHGFTTDFRQYPHSSYASLLSSQPTRLQRRAVLDWFGDRGKFAEAHDFEGPSEAIAHLIGE